MDREHYLRELLAEREHQQILARQQLSRQASSVSRRLTHELSELRLCLSWEPPSIAGALARADNIERFLAQLTSHDGEDP